jgi:peptidoglycan/LPS O-acetylase OafA/YrhL
MTGLDGLRAVAVAGVVWHHSYSGLDALPMMRHGFLGVDLFFVLSGFLITTLLLREQQRSGRISLRHFYIRRALRIFPLYYAVLIALTAYFAAAADSAQRARYFSELPYHAAYLSNWIDSETMLSITWSLSTEEQFYLLWPLLLIALGRRSLAIVVPFLVLNQLVNFGLLDAWLVAIGLPYGDHEILQATFTPLCLGVLLAFALETARSSAIARHPAVRHVVTVLALLLLVVANIPGEFRGWPRVSFQLVAALLVVALVLNPTHWVARALEWRPVAYVGRISYGVYLLHLPVIDVVQRLGLPASGRATGLLFVSSFAGTVVLAALSYTYFEGPLLRLKDRYR